MTVFAVNAGDAVPAESRARSCCSRSTAVGASSSDLALPSVAVQEILCCTNMPGQPVRQECVLQLHSLAVENAALRQSLSQHEHKSQLDIQDLRKLCLANQDKFNYLDPGLLGDLQQQHQGQQDRISTLELEVKDCHGSAQQRQNTLLQVCVLVHLCTVLFAACICYLPLSEC